MDINFFSAFSSESLLRLSTYPCSLQVDSDDDDDDDFCEKRRTLAAETERELNLQICTLRV